MPDINLKLPMVTIEDFKKLEIKIGKVVSAEKIEGTDKLLKLIFDFGTEKRQIIAGIAEFYPDTSALLGKEMPVIVNLEPKMFKGYESQGMILCADADGRPVILAPEIEVPAGSIVK